MQALNAAHAGSLFAPEQQFVVDEAVAAGVEETGLPHRFGVRPPFPNPFRDGATLIQGVADILEQVRPIDARMAVRSPPSRYGGPPPEDASDRARAEIAALLGPVAVSVDEVIRQSGWPPAVVQIVLLELELAGRLERHAGGRVSLA